MMNFSKIALLDYGVGNLYSVANALTKSGAKVILTNRPADIKQADKVMLPGVGAIGDAMMHMKNAGVDVAVKDALLTKPVMAICVGMQAMFDYSTEGGRVDCLGILAGNVQKFDDTWTDCDQPIKIPHVGWNAVNTDTDHVLWDGCGGEHFYFTHSYYCTPDMADARNAGAIVATCDYGVKFCASVIKDNLFITQFHPEKSHHAGLKLLSNFVNWQI
ncbi:imidazole glycerol phosphate synthase subunit HisH [Moraxella nasovis]|uniref:imidazole glycerol phosphate synthase subunit HisH n=1 Tax=Moraxella nasovis TaxID=2904121 RepID=UPI001F62220D|nr:imidazole glycerol phosphate synthase subunit HisH [Moraxella nasovis]UNU74295.1 imidazole glycerol phosphate synthase subunit HisH [Moraxella nasovis]